MVDQNPYVTADNGHGDLAQLAGGVAVITGSASGIGYAIAEHAIRLGMYPVIADIETEAIERAIKDLGRATNEAAVEAFGFTTDVSSEENIQALAEAIEERFPGKPISLLCCNAGVGAGGGVLTATDIDCAHCIGMSQYLCFANVSNDDSPSLSTSPHMLTTATPSSPSVSKIPDWYRPFEMAASAPVPSTDRSRPRRRRHEAYDHQGDQDVEPWVLPAQHRRSQVFPQAKVAAIFSGAA